LSAAEVACHTAARLAVAALSLGAAGAGAQTNSVSPTLPPAAPSTPPAAAAVNPVTSLRVAFTGSMGRQALLVVEGARPRAVAVGESWRGVKLLSVDGSEAVVQIDGQRHSLRLGAAAVNLGGAPAAGSGSTIKLSSDANGHFLANGQINGRSASFMVDTGATLISMSQADAERLGIAYKDAPRIGLRTANGDAVGYQVSLGTVRLGDVDVYNVKAVVQPEPMPFILLGNSFLTRFQMTRENDTLTLDRRF
jgi:aspartyl protease family protein